MQSNFLQKGVGAVAEWLLAERDRWVLWLPVALALGSSVYFLLPEEPPYWTLLPLPLAGLLLAGLALRLEFMLMKWLGVLVLVLGLGVAAGAVKTNLMDAPVLEKPLSIRAVTGTVSEVVRLDKGQKLVMNHLSIERLPPKQTPQQISINLRNSYNIYPGDRVELVAGLFPPPMPASPGAFDFRRHFYFKQIGATGFAVGQPKISATQGQDFRQWLNAKRQSLTSTIQNAMAMPEGAVASALVTGDQRAIPKLVNDQMRDAGLYHILAVSGMNLALVAGILFFTIRYLLVLIPGLAVRVQVKKWAAVAALLGTVAYLLIAGSPVSAERACVMVGLVLVAVMLDRQVTPMRSIGWAALVILLVQPEGLLAPSFQLSFAATLALVAFYEHFRTPFTRWSERSNWWQKILLYVVSISLSTLVAGLATAPFAIYHFGRFATYSLLANMIVLPVVSFWIMPWAMLALLLMPVGLHGLALQPMEWGITYMLEVAEYTSSLPHASLYVPPLTWWGLALLSLGGVWLCIWQRAPRLLGVPLVIAGLLTVTLYVPPDILASGEAKTIAVKDAQEQWVLAKGTGRNFIAKQWLEDAGQDVFRKPKEAAWNDSTMLTCDKIGCIYKRKGLEISIPFELIAVAEDCDLPATVTLLYVPKQMCEGNLLIGGRQLYYEGSHALRIQNAQLHVKSVRDELGNRPWHSQQITGLQP